MENSTEMASKINRSPSGFKFRRFEDKEATARMPLKRMSDVEEEPIEWLWEPYIPFGRLTILGGDPGAGKSFITTGLASALSSCEPLPGECEGKKEALVTLLLAAEDNPADTIKPRLNNLKADQTKIYISTDDIVLDEDGLTAIRDMVIATNARLVIIDPIVAFLDPNMDMNRANAVRHIMKGLARIAKTLNIAILVVRHNRKQQQGTKELHAGMGSIDFTASVRSELSVSEARNGAKFFNHIKTNSGRKGRSIRYEIISLEDKSGMLCWREFTLHNALPSERKVTITRTFKDEEKIKLWLHDLLKDHPDGLPAKDVAELGRLAGYPQTKLEHLKKGIAISLKTKSGWVWKLDHGSRTPLVSEE